MAEKGSEDVGRVRRGSFLGKRGFGITEEYKYCSLRYTVREKVNRSVMMMMMQLRYV